jgi:hypothetical protein
MLTPQQLEIISDEYYLKGFLHGRNRLYGHLKSSYPGVFNSRKNIGESLKYQEVNQFFLYREKPKVVSSTIPRRPLSLYLFKSAYRIILQFLKIANRSPLVK